MLPFARDRCRPSSGVVFVGAVYGTEGLGFESLRARLTKNAGLQARRAPGAGGSLVLRRHFIATTILLRLERREPARDPRRGTRARSRPHLLKVSQLRLRSERDGTTYVADF
jgi:hypothetical protein